MRILLRDLTPGQAYSLQLRAVAEDNVSEWSRVFELVTSVDNTPPDAPEWVDVDPFVVNGDTFVAIWEPISPMEDQNRDFSHYEIAFTNGFVTATSVSFDTTYVLTYDLNKTLFVTPQASVSARVRSVDRAGNASAWSGWESATNPAPAPVDSISVIPSYDGVQIQWQNTPPDDLLYYSLQSSTVSDSSGFLTVYEGTVANFVDLTNDFDLEHWYRVSVIDKFYSASTFVVSGAVKPKPLGGSDGDPPSGSPTPVVSSGIGSLFTRWTPILNADPVVYEIYVSDSDEELYDAANLYGTTTGTSMVITALPSGAPLQPDINYYVLIIATDADTDADNSVVAAPGFGSIRLVDEDDISAEYVYAGNINVGQLTGGILNADITLSSAIKTATDGARVEMDAYGIRVYDSEGTPTTTLLAAGESVFRGEVDARTAIVREGLEIRSTNNELSTGAVLRMASGVTAPKASPTVSDINVLRMFEGVASNNAIGENEARDKFIVAVGNKARFHDKTQSGGEYAFDSEVDISHIVHGITELNGALYGVRKTSSSIGVVYKLTEETIFSDDFDNLANWSTASGLAGISGGKVILSAPFFSDNTSSIVRNIDFRNCAIISSAPILSDYSTATNVSWKFEGTTSSDVVSMTLKAGVLTCRAGINTFNTLYPNATRWMIKAVRNTYSFYVYVDGAWVTLYGVSATLSGMNNATCQAILNQPAGVDAYLNANYTFASGKSNWTSDGTWSVSSGDALIKADKHLESNPFPVIAGRSYYSEARVVPNTSFNAVIQRIFWLDSSGNQIGGSVLLDQQGGPNGSPLILSGIATAPAGAVNAKIRIQFGFGGDSNRVEYAYTRDNIISVANVYIDKFEHLDDVRVSNNISMELFHNHHICSYDNKLYVVWNGPSSFNWSMREMDPRSLSFVGSTIVGPGPASLSTPQSALWIGEANWVAPRIVIAYEESTQVFDMSGSFIHSIPGVARVYNGDDTIPGFLANNSPSTLNILRDSMDYPSGTWNVGFTWAAIGKETSLSVSSAYEYKRRRGLQVDASTFPHVDVTNANVYINRGSGFKFQGQTPNGLNRLLITSLIDGDEPPDITDFGDSEPSSFRSANDELIISAGGVISLGAGATVLTPDGIINSSRLKLAYDTAASTSSDAYGALAVGPTSSAHLRLGKSGIVAMAGDTTPAILNLNTSYTTQMNTIVGNRLVLHDTTDATTNAGNVPALRIGDIEATHLRIDGNEIIAMASDSTTGTLMLNNETGAQVNMYNLNVIGNHIGDSRFNGNIDAPNIPTGGTANVNWNSSNGRIRVIPSSRKFKRDIEDLDIDTAAVLRLEPKRYILLAQDEDDADTPEIGFIAEEARDIGLAEWLTYDAEGALHGFDYMKWVVALQAVCQEQQVRIQTLEDALDLMRTDR